MGAVSVGRGGEVALIWLTALSLFAVLLVQAQRRFPEPFAQARLQLSVEQRELMWAAQNGGPVVELAGFGDVRPWRFVKIRHDDLLERASSGLR